MPPHDELSCADKRRTREFLRLFSANRREIFACIFAMLPDWNDAEDVLQETAVVLWESFDDFQEGTNFKAWACKVAFHQVLSYRKRQKRVPIPLSDVFVEVVVQESAELADTLEAQLRALSGCIDKLKSRDRDLLRRRYQLDIAAKDVAGQLGCPTGTVRKALTRIRHTLLGCIERTLAVEERT